MPLVRSQHPLSLHPRLVDKAELEVSQFASVVDARKAEQLDARQQGLALGRDAATLAIFPLPRVPSLATAPPFWIDGTGLVMRSFSMDFGNQVEPRFLIGAEHILIVDRSELIETTVEAVPLTTYNPYAKAAAAEDVDVTLVHGTQAGHIATLNAPTAQMQRPEGLANAQNIAEWPLRLQPRFSAGNDQWTLTLT